MNNSDVTEEISAVEAALRLGVSRERVIRLVQTRKLVGRRDATLGWRISHQAIEAAANPQHRQEMTRP